MNKNLKKAISAVAALSLSASAVAALAVDFPDVSEDASYYQAVQELSALDVISGFDDGTFRPDELVTRAQITKMIVDALNEREMAEASKAQSKFADVSSEHWARGYINQGVADEFIAGYSDTEFGPDDNVTYVQAQKMLVSAIGYETYAQGSGGWPNGYKIWAASQGITDGISGIADDTQLTRAQVAQLIDNAMGSPICVIKDYDNTIDGRKVPNLEIKDDEGKGYQTLFTKKHNAYKVYGRVTNTNKTDDSIDTDKVEFKVEKAENFDDEWISSNKNADQTERTETMYYGTTNAPNMLRTYAQALIQKDSNDQFTILSIAAAAANKSVTLAAEDFDVDKSDNVNNNLYFYPEGTTKNSKKYTVASDYTVYLNGKETDFNTWDDLIAYIDGHDTAAVTLQKETDPGSTNTSSDYNIIMITSYETAIVEEVVEKSDYYTVSFDTTGSGITSSRMDIQKDDSDYSYSFTLDGAEIAVTDLEKGDVLSIAFDTNAGFSSSYYYDVLVSRNTADGKCTSITSSTPYEYTIGGTKYKEAQGIDLHKEIETSNTYTVYLDHFGRIAKVDEAEDSKKIAILKNIYKKTGGDWYAQIITKDGKEEEHKVDDNRVQTYGAYLKAKTVEADGSESWADGGNGGVTYGKAGSDNSKLALYPQQVIDYTVASSTDKITIKEVLTGADGAGKEYSKSGTKFGSIKLGDNTTILDLSEVDTDDEYSVVSVSSLSDGNYYDVVGYDRTNSGDRYYRFVIITEGTTSFNSESKLAVFNNKEVVDEDGENKTAYKLIIDVEGEGPTEVQYVVADSLGDTYDDLQEGDVILFTLSGANEIKQIAPVFVDTNMVNGKTWDQFQALAQKNPANLAESVINTGLGKDTWQELLDGTSDEMDIVFGVLVNRSGSSVTLATNLLTAAQTESADAVNGHLYADYDSDDNLELSTSGAAVYGYNFGASSKKSRVFTDTGVIATPNYSMAKIEGEGAVDGHDLLDINDSAVAEDVVYAVARVDDDQVKELYVLYYED